MAEQNTWQLHANVNTDFGDSALRVTITYYDETGASIAHKTWRRHVRALWMDGTDWQAYAAVMELEKMMRSICGHDVGPEDLDVPLF